MWSKRYTFCCGPFCFFSSALEPVSSAPPVPLSVVFDMAASQDSRLSGISDEFQRAAEGEGARGKKRELRGYHAPWDTPPVHVLELVRGRSKVNDKTLEELWQYMAAPTEILKWRTECRSSLC